MGSEGEDILFRSVIAGRRGGRVEGGVLYDGGDRLSHITAGLSVFARRENWHAL